MIRDVGKILGVQAQIQRVQDAACHRDSEVSLQMRGVVPHQRGDAIPAGHPGKLQRAGQPARADVQIAVRCARKRTVRTAGNNLDAAK